MLGLVETWGYPPEPTKIRSATCEQTGTRQERLLKRQIEVSLVENLRYDAAITYIGIILLFRSFVFPHAKNGSLHVATPRQNSVA